MAIKLFKIIPKLLYVIGIIRVLATQMLQNVEGKEVLSWHNEFPCIITHRCRFLLLLSLVALLDVRLELPI